MLNIMCPINQLGYGVVSYNICNTICDLGIDTRIHTIGGIDESVVNLKASEAINKNIFDHKPDWTLLKIYHQHLLLERIGNGPYFGFPIFELNKFTPQELSSLKVPDELIVCSKWAADIVQDQLGKAAHVVPLAVDSSIFKPQESNPKEKYIFFNIGKLEVRKGHYILPEVFSKTFEKTDNVELHLLVTNPFLTQEEHEQYIREAKATKLGDKIHFFNRLSSAKEVAKFIQDRDCGVFPSKAEGWNFEVLETMATGKPVITTNYAAHTEYCNRDNAFLIDITELESAYDGKWFFNQGSWAKIGYAQKQQLSDYMRYCYENRPTNINGIKTAEEFTWTKTAQKLLSLIA